MITGADVRRFRKSLRLSQTEFAERLGVSQSALSLIEGGRVGVSEDRLRQLAERFPGSEHEPGFQRFAERLETERGTEMAALSAPMGCFLSLTVWRWQNGFDLNRVPAPDEAAGLITVRAAGGSAIAFQMDKKSSSWERGEILVFAECRTNTIGDGELCLVQAARLRSQAVRTVIAVAHHIRAPQGTILQFEPISPAVSVFNANEVPVHAVFRLMFRGTYTVPPASSAS